MMILNQENLPNFMTNITPPDIRFITLETQMTQESVPEQLLKPFKALKSFPSIVEKILTILIEKLKRNPTRLKMDRI